MSRSLLYYPNKAFLFDLQVLCHQVGKLLWKQMQPWKNPNRSKYVFPWRSCLLLHLPRKIWTCFFEYVAYCVTDERTWQIERCHVQGKESNRIFFQLPKKCLWQQFLKGMNVKIFYPSSRKKRHFKMRTSAKNLARLVFYWTCAS